MTAAAATEADPPSPAAVQRTSRFWEAIGVLVYGLRPVAGLGFKTAPWLITH